MTAILLGVYALLLTIYVTNSQLCDGIYEGTPPEGQSPIPPLLLYEAELVLLNVENVINDIRQLLRISQECWPPDEYDNGIGGSYGPLFIRLAWHCSGTFRSTDDIGGCSGGRQRYPPESSWDDNTNLDKARALLTPIKNKYGIALSWGDLMVLAGTAAIIDMGGPYDEICVGRIDDGNGTNSAALGTFY